MSAFIPAQMTHSQSQATQMKCIVDHQHVHMVLNSSHPLNFLMHKIHISCCGEISTDVTHPSLFTGVEEYYCESYEAPAGALLGLMKSLKVTGFTFERPELCSAGRASPMLRLN